MWFWDLSLYVADGSGNTVASRISTRYGHLNNGDEASLVRTEAFIPYFDSEKYVISHHNGDVYLWHRESNSIEQLTLQAGTAPLAADAVNMLTQTTTNACCLALQNRPQSCSSLHTSSRSSSRTHL